MVHSDDFMLPSPGTIAGAWTMSLSERPDKQLLHADGVWTSCGDFLTRTAVVAGRLAGAGLVAGDRVLLSGPSSVDLAVAHVACLRSGLVVVPVNGGYTGPEIAHIVADSRPGAALVDHEGWEEILAGLFPGLLTTSTGVLLDDAPVPSLDAAAPDHPALIGYTSGTTGAPKGAVLSQENLLAGAESVRQAWHWTAEDRLLLCLPLFHMHGLGVGLHGTLLAGASAVLQQGFDPGSVLSEIVDHDCTMFFGVPTMYHRMVDEARVEALGNLRLCVSGSAPLSPLLHGRLRDMAGSTVLERYGMTETVMLVSNPYEGERRAGSVGFPLPGVELRLAEGTGEIQVRGPNVFGGYWQRPDADDEAFVEDAGGRWFRTGDLGSVDADGYLSIVGRAKELIITGGLNVHPREVDDVVAGHPGGAEVAVAGVRSEEWGEDVVAWIVPTPGLPAPDAEAIRGFARDNLAAHKLPRRVVIVDSLPRNALGKVLRHELREAVADG